MKTQEKQTVPAAHTEARFHDEAAAREYLENIRWPNGSVCPHCGGADRQSKLEGKSHRAGLFFCGHCREQYTVTVGTVFERSKIALHKWVYAAHMVCTSKKGVSSKQLERVLGVTYKTAWFMSHRIREAMKSEGGMLGGGGSTLEADETYIGRKPGRKISKGVGHKEKVLALVERQGHVRAIHLPDVTAKTLKQHLMDHVRRDTNIMTDELKAYSGLSRSFESHDTVNHSRKEYVRDDAYTNTVEGFFSIFKRGIYGVYQHVSSQHLQRYATEFEFRYNNRSKMGVEDAQRTVNLLKGISGKRLMYNQPN